MNRFDPVRMIYRPLLFLCCLAPVALLAWLAAHDGLSANPIADITNATGLWTLRLLGLTLLVTPLKHITGLGSVSRFRRMLGLFTFFYALLHVATYVWLDKFFDWSDISDDLLKRRFIVAGAIAFSLMVPLAMTSFQKAQKVLGGKRWTLLHRLTYIAAIAGILHFGWRVKADYSEPMAYTAVFALLLGYRLIRSFRTRAPQHPSSPSA